MFVQMRVNGVAIIQMIHREFEPIPEKPIMPVKGGAGRSAV